MGSRARYRSWLSFARSATAIAVQGKYDLVFASSTPLTAAIPAIVLNKVKKVPYVFEVRDVWPELPIAMGELTQPQLRAAALRLERMAYANAAHVVALSPGMRDSIVAKGVPRNHVSVIPNSCDFDAFTQGNDGGAWFRAAHPNLQGKHILTYAGTVGRANRVDYIAELAAHVDGRQIAFVVVGEGNELERVRSTARRLGVEGESIFLLPPIPKKRIPSLFAASSVVVSTLEDLPALRHSSPNKVFDAMAAGKPLAINYGGWLSDLILERDLGLVLSKDVSQSADMLTKLVLDNYRIEQCGQNSAKAGRELFDRDAHFDALNGILESALRSGRTVAQGGRS
jgi:glycosyltransferase involved in cell wall biosynthesis